MEKVEEYFVIEMPNSREDLPDYLKIDGDKIKWISINVKAGNPSAQKEVALHQATHFKNEDDAVAETARIFGDSYKVRITRHFRYR